MTISYSRFDLDYLFEQVSINYRHVDRAGTNPVEYNFVDASGDPIPFNYSELNNALDPGGVREVSGANNNLVGSSVGNRDAFAPFTPGPYTTQGEADSDFLRIFQPTYSAQAEGYGTSVDYDPTSEGGGTTAPFVGTGVVGTDVIDATPRLIANLVNSSIVDPSNPAYNPAAAQTILDEGGQAVPVILGNNTTSTGAFIPNAGVLGGVQYNEWFVAFGQFFDHGLDFIQKGGFGTVAIPIPQGDPLFDATPGALNMMFLARGQLANENLLLVNPDADFNGGINTGDADDLLLAIDPLWELPAGETPVYENNTGLSIDQSQTYGSDASVNALIREYTDIGGGTIISTGRLLTGAADGLLQDGTAPTGTPAEIAEQLDALDHSLGTWADLKANATLLGITLTDADVGNAPQLRVDPTGMLLFTPDPAAGYTTSSLTTDAGYDANTDPFVRNPDGTVALTNQAFLSDVSFGAIPLDRHYVSGDHRANENIGLTAVHNVFHEEHNIQAENLQNALVDEYNLILGTDGQSAADEFISGWLADQTTPPVGTVAGPSSISWNGNAIFQAARIVTESQYNHIAVDQYVGALHPGLPEFVSYSADIDMGVSLEFSQAVFRLGHSMLTETVQVAVDDSQGRAPTDPGYVPTYVQESLFGSFLNPDLYAQHGPEAITLGLINQFGNEVDEFVTPALQQALVGIPLDLAALNIARGREVGLPTFNELREQLFLGLADNTSNNSNSAALAPYVSWSDLGAHLRHEGTLANLIAAYARDEGDVWGIQSARANALAGVDPDGAGPLTAADNLSLLRAQAQKIIDAAADDLSVDHLAAVDFLNGTYAPPNGNPQGNLEYAPGDLGFWDIDLWVGGLAEKPLFEGVLGTTFSYVMLDFGQRMQDGDRFYYLYRQPPGHHLGNQIIAEQFADLITRTTGLEHINGDAFGTAHETFTLTANSDFFLASNEEVTFSDLTVGPASDGHIIVVGGAGNDRIILGNGDDTGYGDEGDDYIQGGQGNDHLYGGAGNDFIIDDENDDFIHGGTGNDTIFAGPGVLDTSHGGTGNDEVHGGEGIDEVFGEEGDDALFGEGDTDLLLGGDGNDYIDGGDSVDEEFGGNGNDWLRGGVGDDHLNGGSGNDLMEGGLGPAANDGDRYFGDTPVNGLITEVFNGDGTEGLMDIASYEDVDIAITANLQTSNANGTASNLIDTYAFVEGLVGSRFDDDLTGADASAATSNGPDNYLVGGAGNDILTGLGGDDTIFGDVMVVNQELLWDTRLFTNFFQGFSNEDRPDFGDFALNPDGTPDFSRPLYGHYLGDNFDDGATVGSADTAVYRGQVSDYTFTILDDNGTAAIEDDVIRVIDNRASTVATYDGADVLKDIEFLQFADANGDPLSPVALNTLVFGATSGNDSIIGTPDPDFISALGGNDTIRALESDDTIFGDAGDDLIEGAGGGDAIDGGAGFDTATFAGSAAGVDVDLVLSATNTGDAAGDTYVSIEGLVGSDFADNLFATGGANDIQGGAGDDMLHGRAGNDTLDGGDGNDTVVGSLGDDELFGGVGNDRLAGGAGNDTINAGEGNDFLIGGGGNDALNGEAGNDTLRGNTNDDILNGGSGADVLNGDAGADIFVFADNHGFDRIIVWQDGIDQIDFSNHGAYNNFADVQANLTQAGNHARIHIDADNDIRIFNTDVADIDVNDFLFI